MDGLPGYDEWKQRLPVECEPCDCGDEDCSCDEDDACDEAYERWADK